METELREGEGGGCVWRCDSEERGEAETGTASVEGEGEAGGERLALASNEGGHVLRDLL